ncbi:MAG: hypothetical protein ACRDWW_06650 [Acidimicrobiales bacterium]
MAGSAALEPGVAIGVEEAAAVGGEAEVFVGDAGVDGAADGQEAVPCAAAVLEGGFAVEGGPALESLHEPADAVRLDVGGVVGGQEAAFLGEEKEHDAHHGGDDSVVEVVVAHPGEELAVAGLVQGVECADEELDGVTDLAAEGLGDLLLAAEAFGEELWEPVLRFLGQEAAPAEQGDEGSERFRFFTPEAGVPHARRGGGAPRGPDEGPPATVGDDSERHVPGAQQPGEAVDGAGGPAAGGDGCERVGSPRAHHGEQPPRSAVVDGGWFGGSLLGLVGAVCFGFALVAVGGVVFDRCLFGVERESGAQDDPGMFWYRLGEGVGQVGGAAAVVLPVEGVSEDGVDQCVASAAGVVEGVFDEGA